MLEEAFREKRGEGTINRIIMAARRVVGTWISTCGALGEERISSSFARKWLKSSLERLSGNSQARANRLTIRRIMAA